jgi:hypothetical protein
MNNYTYKFTKGTKLRLDDIYFIQALGQDWWEFIPSKGTDGKETIGEDIIITRDVEINISVKYPCEKDFKALRKEYVRRGYDIDGETPIMLVPVALYDEVVKENDRLKKQIGGDDK